MIFKKSFNYDIKNFKGDLTGGLVAGVVALPLALAFGVQSGMGAAAGLYGAIALGIFAALFGGTDTQASGPTGPMTVVTAVLVSAAIGTTGDLESAMGIIVMAFMAAGLIQIFFGLLNIASYVKYFPYPVISGFMSGVGLIIIILQIFPFIGLQPTKSTWAVMQELPRLVMESNWQSILLGTLTVAIYYISPRIIRAIPSALLALVVASLVSYFAGMDVPVIGSIPSGFPELQFREIFNVDSSAYKLIIEYAMVLAVLGSIDSLLTSVIADNMTKTKHNSNRELIGQGLGNLLAGAFGGIPGAGATKGTVVNINAGGRSKLSGAIHGLVLLTVLLGLGSVAAHIPLCVLAGLLIPIGIKIIDFKGLKHLAKIPRADAVVLILVLLITSFGSLIQAVGIGLALACLLFMKKAGDLSKDGIELTLLSDFENFTPRPDEVEFYESFKDRVIIKHLNGPLFFGFTSAFKDGISELSSDIKILILRMDRVPYIDQSGLYAIEDVIFELRKNDVEVIIVGLQDQPYDMMNAVDIIPDLVKKDELYDHIEDSFEYIRSKRNCNSHHKI